MMALAIVFNCLGMLTLELIMFVLRGGKAYVRPAKGIRVIDLATTVFDDFIFNVVYIFIGVTSYIVYTNQIEYENEDIIWGIVHVFLATLAGGIVAGSASYDGVQWGTFKCNMVGCLCMAA